MLKEHEELPAQRPCGETWSWRLGGFCSVYAVTDYLDQSLPWPIARTIVSLGGGILGAVLAGKIVSSRGFTNEPTETSEDKLDKSN